MAGVSLVGYSGSLIKDTLHEATTTLILGTRALFSGPSSAADAPIEEPIEKPEATKVLIGNVVFFHMNPFSGKLTVELFLFLQLAQR